MSAVGTSGPVLLDPTPSHSIAREAAQDVSNRTGDHAHSLHVLDFTLRERQPQFQHPAAASGSVVQINCRDRERQRKRERAQKVGGKQENRASRDKSGD